VLSKQDDRTSNAVIALLEGDPAFKALSTSEGEGIIKRDAEDEKQLAKGIELSVSRGVLPANVEVEPTVEVDVKGKSADEVADEIIAKLGGGEGQVVVLQGLSGTGKGTTVGKLQAKLPKCVSWSNGNVFRSVTLLATKDCEAKGIEFSPEVLTTENVAEYMKRLSFKKQEDGSFDIEIDCYDKKYRVADIVNTVLKEPTVGGRVPTVAGTCQGEVVLFAGEAVKTLKEAGHNVLLEGRAQTLNHIRTPTRFTLVIREPELLGSRRAAQRVMAGAVDKLKGAGGGDDAAVAAAVKEVCKELSAPSKPAAKPAADKAGPAATLTWEVLSKQDDRTSNAVIALLEGDPAFKALSTSEGEGIIKRDAEDEKQLAKGIELSVSRGVLPANVEVEPTVEVDVKGKSADEVADEIIAKLGGGEGQVVVLQGLSGTGKGTTVGKLQAKLPKCVSWSNGNVFRSVTLLATKDCEAKGIEFSPEVLTTENVAEYMKRLSFKKQEDGSFDIEIDCYDKKYRVADIVNTVLKEPTVGGRVPTVAGTCQGEVVLFAGEAVKTLKEAGHNVLLEGRAQTLNHIRTPTRFTLVIREPELLGSRRAAQRVMAGAVDKLKGAGGGDDAAVAAAVKEVCKELSA